MDNINNKDRINNKNCINRTNDSLDPFIEVDVKDMILRYESFRKEVKFETLEKEDTPKKAYMSPKPIKIMRVETVVYKDFDHDSCSESDNNSEDNETDDDDTDDDDYVHINYNPCRCIRCDLVFNNDTLFHHHHCNGKPGQHVDEILEAVNGQHSCPICNKRYSTANILGEHFMLSHGNFDDLAVLDTKIKRTGFPGFDILIYIGMIEDMSSKEIWYNVLFESQCPICLTQYRFKDTEPKNLFQSEEYGYTSDSEVIYRRQEQINNMYPTKNKQIYIRAIKDEQLSKIIDKFKDLCVLPHKMTCCSRIICQECLQNHLSITDTLICPFCKKDHTRTDLKYIEFYDIVDKIDMKKWVEWRTDHLDIFL
jgi:hypothetical protein